MDVTPTTRSKPVWQWLLLSISLIFISTLSIYYTGLFGGYEFDDSTNIELNPWLEIDDLSPVSLYRAGVASGIAGPLKRPISMASFAINRYLTGLDPFYMKLTNVVIHALNGVGLLLLSLLLLQTYNKIHRAGFSNAQCQWLALAISLSWVVHPLALTSTLYIVQRMTSLSALFTICGLIGYVVARQRMLNNKSSIALMLGCLIVFSVFGAFSKENGLLLPFFALAIEACLFNFRCPDKKQKQFLYGVFAIMVVLPGVLFMVWIIINPDWLLHSYQNREFSLVERLMTESRVLWFYLQMILLPDITKMGLYHDDFSVSTSLLSPWTTLPAIIGLVLLAVYAGLKRQKLSVLAFAVFFFFAGHSMESTIISLELVHEHRNYLPMYGVIFALVFYVIHPKLDRSSLNIRSIVVILFIGLLASGTAMRSSTWSNVAEHSFIEVQNHPESGRALFQAGKFSWEAGFSQKKHRERYFLQARSLLLRAKSYNEYKVMSLISLIHLSFLTGMQMEEQWLEELVSALNHERLPVGVAAMIPKFINCHIVNICMLDKNALLDIFNAALNNPALGGEARSVVLSAGARYMVSQQEYATAVVWFRESAELARSRLTYRLMLIDLLIERGQFDEARKHIGMAHKLDSLSVYQQDISRLENKLAGAAR